MDMRVFACACASLVPLRSGAFTHPGVQVEGVSQTKAAFSMHLTPISLDSSSKENTVMLSNTTEKNVIALSSPFMFSKPHPPLL